MWHINKITSYGWFLCNRSLRVVDIYMGYCGAFRLCRRVGGQQC